MTHFEVKAHQVALGDFIPSLDNGYVVEVEKTGGIWSAGRVSLPDNMTAITYHDCEGNECYLILPEDSLLTVDR